MKADENKKDYKDMTADELKAEQARILKDRGFTDDEINALIY